MAPKVKTTKLGEKLYEDKKLHTLAAIVHLPEEKHDFLGWRNIAVAILFVVIAAGVTAGIIWLSKLIQVSPETGHSIFVRICLLITALVFLIKIRVTKSAENIFFFLIGLFWVINPALNFWLGH